MENFELTNLQLKSKDTNKDWSKYDTFIILFEPKQNMYSIRLGYGTKAGTTNADWGVKTYIKIDAFVATTELLTAFTIEYHRRKTASKAGSMFDDTITIEQDETKQISSSEPCIFGEE